LGGGGSANQQTKKNFISFSRTEITHRKDARVGRGQVKKAKKEKTKKSRFPGKRAESRKWEKNFLGAHKQKEFKEKREGLRRTK